MTGRRLTTEGPGPTISSSQPWESNLIAHPVGQGSTLIHWAVTTEEEAEGEGSRGKKLEAREQEQR